MMMMMTSSTATNSWYVTSPGRGPQRARRGVARTPRCSPSTAMSRPSRSKWLRFTMTSTASSHSWGSTHHSYMGCIMLLTTSKYYISVCGCMDGSMVDLSSLSVTN
ncbi:hypothetical protein BDA96_10G002400 [Sorghum bicolor]|uniref:Uncharacterized protein n=2 Tax=Sorghum bicolor TaxID=4558 RepID=A0A921Q0F5_SORBI|nr:hypothetical protein BDA96_10G002400 [Sorghum bicolor]OQU75674.1 hypothetical protein SORBI_3010G002301 [Sorghum bicolor]